MAASEATVEGQEGERSREGSGVKLKSPISQMLSGCAERAGARVERRNSARSDGPVHGQYVLTRVKACPAHLTFRVWKRPQGEGWWAEVKMVGEGRTRIATPLLS